MSFPAVAFGTVDDSFNHAVRTGQARPGDAIVRCQWTFIPKKDVNEQRTTYKPSNPRNQSLSHPTRAQPGRLVSLGTGSARTGEDRTETNTAFDRLFGVSLVPRDGARII